MKISYGILTHNEGESIEKLIKQLLEIKREQDEIIVVDDYSTDSVTKSIIEKYQIKGDINLFYNHLDNNFAAQKNFLNSKCEGDWIVNIDSDEILKEKLKENLITILEVSNDIDVIMVPRENYVKGITPEHIKKWEWSIDKQNRINYPDFQWRIYKNRPEIRWFKNVHEMLEGFNKIVRLYINSDLDLLHIKDIERQEKQNNFYETIFP